MKYLMFKHPVGGAETPLFCCSPMTHSELAEVVSAQLGVDVVSAGFCEFTTEGVRTFGKSDTLKLTPRPQDARIIAVFTELTVRQALASEVVQRAANFAAYP